MTDVKRWVQRAAYGTESFHALRDTQGRTEPDLDEGPFYVLASDYEALVTENVILEGSLRLYERYREALVRIADSDYRGNCPTEIEIARRALGPEYD
jgi:hypothetical protein